MRRVGQNAASGAVLVALALLLAACGASGAAEERGGEVSSRIVSLEGHLTEVVVALGLGDQLVGRDESSTDPAVADRPVVTRGHDVSAESVLSLDPTVVLADEESGPAGALDQIRGAGVRVEVLDRPTTVEEVVPRIAAIAGTLGVDDAGDLLARRVEEDLAAALDLDLSEDARPTVAFLYLRGTAGVYLLGGPGAGTDSMIVAAGGRDAGTELGLDRAFTPLTAEALVGASPDVILTTSTGLESVGGVDGLLRLSGVAQTPAGQSGRVVTMEDGLLFSFGPRTPGAVLALAEAIAATDDGASRDAVRP